MPALATPSPCRRHPFSGHGARLLFASFLAGILGTHPQQASAMSVEEAMRRALLTHSAIGEARANRSATEAGLDQARSLLGPSLEINLFAGPGLLDRSFNTRSQDRNVAFGGGAALVGEQLLYDGGTTRALVAREAARVDSAALRVLSRVESVALSTTLAYLEVLRVTELGRIADRSLATHQRIMAGIRTGAAGGALAQGDVILAQERLHAAEALQVDIRRRRAEAEATFLRNVGQPPSGLRRPASRLAAVPPDLPAAVERVRRVFPDVAVAEADVNAARADWQAAQGAVGPRVALEGRVARIENANGISGSQNDLSLVVRLRMPLYDGGRNLNRVREQAARVTEARQRLERVREEAELEVRQTWATLANAGDSLRALNQQVRAAREVTTNFAQQFEAGRRSLLDRLNAENTLVNAEVALVTADFARDAAVLRMLALTGSLLSVYGVEVPTDTLAPRRIRGSLNVPVPSAESDPWPLPPPTLIDTRRALDANR